MYLKDCSPKIPGDGLFRACLTSKFFALMLKQQTTEMFQTELTF